MRKRLMLALALMLLMGLLAPLTTAQEPVILRYPINPDPEHLNPFTATTVAIGTITRNIYEGLTQLDFNTSEPMPALAESWDISDDNLTYTFHIRQGVLYHDVAGVEWDNGDREVKAEDFVWTAQMYDTDDETISQHPELLDGVVGAEAFRNGEADSIEGVQALDDYTLQITLEQPNRLFFTAGAGGLNAVPREAYEQLGDAFNTTPVGTGPFKFVEWLRDDKLTLTKNEEYWDPELPKADGIEYVNVPEDNTALGMYRNGELDFLFSFPSGQRQAVIDEFSDQFHEIPGLNVRYFGFKMDTGFFSENPLVRQAFNHAFNRDLVWNELMEGARYPADQGVLPPSMPASTPSVQYDYDLEKAAQLLEEAGFPNGEGLPELTVYIFASARDELSFPVLQQDLATLGVTLNIEIEDNSTYWSHIGEDEVVMFLSGWSAGVNDPSDVFNFLFLDARDDTHYDNPEVNDLLRAAMTEYDADARNQLYQQAHDLIMADAPWIVSAYSKVAWLQQPWVEGFEPFGGGTYTARLKYVTKSS
ncbi:MAG: ABC transporter substrate-binding protein [Anaerolineae bacterium]|nr:ABC transporter substrate-binding protein [Anaerolineae bacterium]